MPGVEAPDSCWACGKDLPVDRVKGNVKYPTEVQPTKPTQSESASTDESAESADPFANYPKNRHEEFLVEVAFIRTVLSNPNLKQFILDKCWTEAELDKAQGLLNLPPYLVAQIKNSIMFKIHNGIEDEEEEVEEEDEEEDEDEDDDSWTDDDLDGECDEIFLKYLKKWTPEARLDFFINDLSGCSEQAIANFIRRTSKVVIYTFEELLEFNKRWGV
jgi:hypothetical protein